MEYFCVCQAMNSHTDCDRQRTRLVPNLELKIPPVVQVLIVAVAMGLIDHLWPATHLDGLLRLLVTGLAGVVGATFCVAGVMRFRQANTTVNPTTPEASSTLVTTGVYGITRNPMYIGFLLMLIAWGLWLANLYTLPFTAVFVAYMNRYQIQPEERMLGRLFGSAYVAYMQRVRRWL